MEPSKILPLNKKVPVIGLTYHSKVPVDQQPSVNKSVDAYNLFIENWNMDTIELQEEFSILLLSTSKRAHGIFRVSKGGLNATIIDPKLIFTAALKTRAHAIIIAHNHPSLNLTPSQADINITRKLIQAGEILDIKVLDHLIITPFSYYSFSEEGII
ncbi:JAB domain-containing protein [Sphingobacterium detergens]|uniref:DNA repair protein RadC n=1 Tax=Sphingobacterium detergens TaxID=1145106 RepID=A0A420ARU3_SPHD1|nr:JAB domain-containing protein [Sphingobacterium detergens]RKE47140.1 DNA repair protein RadC [Sphingobacterium detergens]